MFFIGLRSTETHPQTGHNTKLYLSTQHMNGRITLEGSIWCEQNVTIFILLVTCLTGLKLQKLLTNAMSVVLKKNFSVWPYDQAKNTYQTQKEWRVLDY